MHPLVRDAERAFLREHAEHGAAIAVMEIPLLFETGADKLVDADDRRQRARPKCSAQRLLQRPGLSEAKLDRLLARQMPDAEKRARADFVVDTSGDSRRAEAALDAVIAELRGRRGEAYARHWA